LFSASADRYAILGVEMKALKILLIAAGIAAASASSASASTTYATLVDYNPVGTIAADRSVPSNALGPSDGLFLSLGLTGSAVFSFGTDFTGPAAVVEVTNGNRSDYLETAQVWGGTSYDPGTNSLASFALLGVINNSLPTAILAFTGIYKYLAIVDTSSGAGRDGFDIDSVSVSAVPLPAGVVLLGSGVALLGFVGRRRKRTAVAA
jgi:hypothetical protein